jgi:cell division protein FtsB
MTDFDELKLPGPTRALDEAIAFLAPQTTEDHEFAVERVTRLACLFYCWLHAEKSSPRVSVVRAEVAKLAADVQRLSDTFNSLDDSTYSELAKTGLAEPHKSFLTAGFSEYFSDADDFKNDWTSRLDALSEAIALKLAKFDEIYPRDVGGRNNLMHYSMGSAKWNLVYRARYIFDDFRPGVATGTEGGEFHEFVKRIFELATNKEPEEHSKLQDWVKRICTIGRQLSAVDDEIFDIETETYYPKNSQVSEKTRNQTSTAEVTNRLTKLTKRKAELEAQIRKLRAR